MNLCYLQLWHHMQMESLKTLGLKVKEPRTIYTTFLFPKEGRHAPQPYLDKGYYHPVPLIVRWSLHFPQEISCLQSLLPFAFFIISPLSTDNISSMSKFQTKQDLWSFCPPPALGSTALSQLLRKLSLLLSKHHPQG